MEFSMALGHLFAAVLDLFPLPVLDWDLKLVQTFDRTLAVVLSFLGYPACCQYCSK